MAAVLAAGGALADEPVNGMVTTTGPAKAVSGMVVAPKPIHGSCGTPDYPAEARIAEQTGSVTLQLLAGTDGGVHDARVAVSSGFPLLDQSALAAARSCRFEPGLTNGLPAAGWMSWKFTFKLDPADLDAVQVAIRLGMFQRMVDTVMARCETTQPVLHDAMETARKDWHETNDAAVAQAQQLKRKLFATLPARTSQGMTTQQFLAKVDAMIETKTGEAAKEQADKIAGPNVPDAGDACMNFGLALADGHFDFPAMAPKEYAFVQAAQTAQKKTP